MGLFHVIQLILISLLSFFQVSVIIIAIIAYQKGNQPQQQYYFQEEIFNCFLSSQQLGLENTGEN